MFYFFVFVIFSIVLFTSLLLPLGFSFVLGVVLAPFSWVGLWAGLLFPCVCLCSWLVLSSIVLFAPRGCPLAYSRFPLFCYALGMFSLLCL